MPGPRPLTGRRVVTTRDEPGRLDSLLAAAGADVIHVPLIEIADPPDGGAALFAALQAGHRVDWLVITSRHGARRVGAAAAGRTDIRLAAVGTRTERELAEIFGRQVDVVPETQTAAGLLEAMPSPASGERVVIAQADRADGSLVAGLRVRGFEVTPVTAYSTVLRHPSLVERRAALGADVLALASGSAAEAWAGAIGPETPRFVVAIGPTTERVALAAGLKVTHVAADHSVEGLAAEITAALTIRS